MKHFDQGRMLLKMLSSVTVDCGLWTEFLLLLLSLSLSLFLLWLLFPTVALVIVSFPVILSQF